MKNLLEYPFDPHSILRKKKSLKRNLLKQGPFIEKRIAILGGSTTAEIKDILELFLLDTGIKAVFYESDYNRYYEDIMFGNTELTTFKPDLIYIHTNSINIYNFPELNATEDEVTALLKQESERFELLWDKIANDFDCSIIQNNFDLPHHRILGNLDAWDIHGKSYFLLKLNLSFAESARSRKNLYLNDINYLSSWLGLSKWYDKSLWYAFKYAMSYEAIPHLAHNLAAIIAAIVGKTRKCIVLDLDNTLWGGVIGDDGITGIQIGNETALAEAYTDFQQYLTQYKKRGVLLAVCSKNEVENAQLGFSHPDSVLKENDFSSFVANWNPKNENIELIASEINIGINSLVFIDDNPAEREIVRAQLPDVAVPEIGNDISKYIDIIDKSGYFETIGLSQDDLERQEYYASNLIRQTEQSQFKDYGEYLESLKMSAEIKPFEAIYLDRITQLTNKTNQFNTTTKRCSFSEIEQMSTDHLWLTLYGRLKDKFGDNGVVSVIAARIKDEELHIELWLMSCRVLKRDMEFAMFDQLVVMAKDYNIKKIVGYYYQTDKNKLVCNLFKDLGFENQNNELNEIWYYKISENYKKKNNNIMVVQ